MARCSNCRFHHKGPPDHCRLNPPTAFGVDKTQFPLVKPEWYCGQHRLSFWKLIRPRKEKQ